MIVASSIGEWKRERVVKNVGPLNLNFTLTLYSALLLLGHRNASMTVGKFYELNAQLPHVLYRYLSGRKINEADC